MVLSSEGLHLLSSVAVWRHDFETINDKNVAMWHCYYIDVINFYITKENHREWIDDKKKEKKKEYSTSSYCQKRVKMQSLNPYNWYASNIPLNVLPNVL